MPSMWIEEQCPECGALHATSNHPSMWLFADGPFGDPFYYCSGECATLGEEKAENDAMRKAEAEVLDHTWVSADLANAAAVWLR